MAGFQVIAEEECYDVSFAGCFLGIRFFVFPVLADSWPFASDIHFGGCPRRLPWPLARRSTTKMACSICSRSERSSASIVTMSILDYQCRTMGEMETHRVTVGLVSGF
jgi:hypothetical protein